MFKSVGSMTFPEFSGIRCTMMPYIQGDLSSVPVEYHSYADAIESNCIDGERGKIGFLTIHESFVESGKSQRGFGAGSRKLHTEGCKSDTILCWGGIGWGSGTRVELENDLRVLIANSIDSSCAVWDKDHEYITEDGDLSEYLDQYPLENGYLMKAGELINIGIKTPHECINQNYSGNRQFFRIVGSGVHGVEPYFTTNELMKGIKYV